MTVLLDSVILIDHFNGIEAATQYIRDMRDEACISPVTRAEVLTGFADDDARRRAESLLNVFPLLPITEREADIAARLRRTLRLKLPDAFQAAVAGAHGLQLATRNTKDFDEAKHPFVTVPYTLT